MGGVEVAGPRSVKIVFVAPWVPCQMRPRSLAILTSLARDHEVHLLALYRNKAEASLVNDLDTAIRVTLVRNGRFSSIIRCLLALLRRRSLQSAYANVPEFRSALNRLIKVVDPDAVHFNVFRTVHLVDDTAEVPVIIDLDEFRSEYYAQLSTTHSRVWWRWLGRYEAPRMAAGEQRLVASGHAILLSKARADIGTNAQNLFEVPSVVLGSYVESSDITHDFDLVRNLVFVGRFTYEANVSAVNWFVSQCWPIISEALPDLRLRLVGSDPPVSVQRLASNSIEVTGYVASTRPYYHSAIAIIPLVRATGVQLKLIEAFEEGAPVVCTPIVAKLADVTDGAQVLVASSSQEWVESILRLIKDSDLRRGLRRLGGQWVEESHSWKALELSLDRAYRFATADSV